MLRAYCSDWDGGETVPPLSRDEIHHLVRVRRVRTGETVEILNGRGDVARCSIGETGAKSVNLSLLERTHHAPSPLRRHLLVAFPKGKTLPVLLQKAVELGVDVITPLLTDNVEVGRDRAEQKKDRLEAVLVEALKQSGNPWLPELKAPVSLAKALDGRNRGDVQRLCAALQPDARPLWTLMQNCLQRQGVLEIFVGPEGDFSATEYEQLRQGGCLFATLGPLVLRVETAASLVLGAVGLWMQSEGD